MGTLSWLGWRTQMAWHKYRQWRKLSRVFDQRNPKCLVIHTGMYDYLFSQMTKRNMNTDLNSHSFSAPRHTLLALKNSKPTTRLIWNANATHKQVWPKHIPYHSGGSPSSFMICCKCRWPTGTGGGSGACSTQSCGHRQCKNCGASYQNGGDSFFSSHSVMKISSSS